MNIKKSETPQKSFKNHCSNVTKWTFLPKDKAKIEFFHINISPNGKPFLHSMRFPSILRRQVSINLKWFLVRKTHKPLGMSPYCQIPTACCWTQCFEKCSGVQCLAYRNKLFSWWNSRTCTCRDSGWEAWLVIRWATGEQSWVTVLTTSAFDH